MNKINYDRLNETLYHEKLDNGLDVYYLEKKDFYKKYSILATKYGSVDNEFIPINGDEYIQVPKGIAHFLEHKLFEKESGDMSFEFTKLGGDVNAFTSYNRTAYMFTTEKNFYKNLELLLDMVQTPYFTKELIEKEIGIINQEIGMYADYPDHNIYIQLLQNMYKENSVRDNILGTEESISKITKQDLDNCYNTFYHPSNMLLFSIGDIDHKKYFDLVKSNQNKKHFSPSKEIKRKDFLEDNKVIKKYEEMHSDVSIPKLLIGLKIDFNNLAQDVLNKYRLLTGLLLDMTFSKISPFYEELLDSELINDTFGHGISFYNTFNFIELYSDTHKPVELKEKLINKLNSLKTESLDEELFEVVKNKFIASNILRFNYLETTANLFIRYKYMDMNMFELIELAESISFEDLNNIKYIFEEEAISSIIMYPKK